MSGNILIKAKFRPKRQGYFYKKTRYLLKQTENQENEYKKVF